MGQEHAPETVWRAQELYCSDRLSFVRVAELTGVADSTVRRWADTYGWREKREQIARAEAEIRADKILARAKTVKALLNKPDPQMAFAVSSLEAQALKEAEAARQGAIRAETKTAQAVTIETPADAITALRRAVEQKLTALLTRPEAVDLRAVQDVQKSLALIADMQSALPANEAENTDKNGITADLHARLVDALTRGA